MNLTNRSLAFMALMMLLTILVPALTGLVGLVPDDELPDDDDDLSVINNISLGWNRMLVHQMASGLILGLSIFALFVVYLGGRTNHKRFNDRTIDSVKLLPFVFSRTALSLLRAVFVFLFFGLYVGYRGNELSNHILFSTPLRSLGRLNPKFQMLGGILP